MDIFLEKASLKNNLRKVCLFEVNNIILYTVTNIIEKIYSISIKIDLIEHFYEFRV